MTIARKQSVERPLVAEAARTVAVLARDRTHSRLQGGAKYGLVVGFVARPLVWYRLWKGRGGRVKASRKRGSPRLTWLPLTTASHARRLSPCSSRTCKARSYPSRLYRRG